MFDENMIDTIEKRINNLGIKKSHVAKQIGCTPMEFTHFLKKRRNLRSDSIERLIKYFHLY